MAAARCKKTRVLQMHMSRVLSTILEVAIRPNKNIWFRATRPTSPDPIDRKDLFSFFKEILSFREECFDLKNVKQTQINPNQ